MQQYLLNSLFKAAKAWVRSKQESEEFTAEDYLEADLFFATIDAMEFMSNESLSTLPEEADSKCSDTR